MEVFVGWTQKNVELSEIGLFWRELILMKF